MYMYALIYMHLLWGILFVCIFLCTVLHKSLCICKIYHTWSQLSSWGTFPLVFQDNVLLWFFSSLIAYSSSAAVLVSFISLISLIMCSFLCLHSLFSDQNPVSLFYIPSMCWWLYITRQKILKLDCQSFFSKTKILLPVHFHFDI